MARRPIALTALSAVAAAVLAAGPARAEGDSMRYEEPQDPHYFRSIFEILAINVIGNVDYRLNTADRGGTAHPGDRLCEILLQLLEEGAYTQAHLQNPRLGSCRCV